MSELNNKIIEILEDIRKWVKFSGWNNVKNVLTENLQSDRDKLIYHLSDGNRGIRDIVSESKSFNMKTSYGGVHSLWHKWSKIGIVEPITVGRGERYRKLFLFEDFGIDIPLLTSEKIEEELEEEEEEEQIEEEEKKIE